MDIEEEFTASNDHTQIVKRKRTKRQRTGLVVTSSSSSGGSGGDCGGGDGYFSTPSPTTSSNFSANSEEDEDMANCLMLLSQSSAPPTQHQGEKKVEKLTSRKINAGVGVAAATTGKGGFYVYECKTCNRTFTSFQALGGHRASHKKPKAAVPPAAVVEEKKSPVAQSDCDEEIFNHQFDKISDYIQPISVQRDNKGVIDGNNNKAKIHECSICGSEFLSGQALGGHMRRHRTPPVAAAAEPEKPRRFLLLDLNLPAPEEDCRDSEFVFTPNHQQHNLVFSAPALVDCHY